MNYDESHSVTRLIRRLNDEDHEGAEQIWRRCFQRLLPLTRAKLKALPHQAVDEEDVGVGGSVRSA